MAMSTFAGMATERLPARVFGSLTMVRPDIAVVRVTTMVTSPFARSMSFRRRPRTSPLRS